MSKSKSKAEEALQFLDDLDNFTPEAPPPSGESGTAPTNSANPSDPTDVLKFIDEITQKSSEPTRPANATPLERPSSRASLATPTGTIRKATERVRVGSPAPSSAGSNASKVAEVPPRTPTPSRAEAPANDAGAASAGKGGGWGWGSVWSSASAAIQQARTAVDEGVKHLPINNEQATKWKEEVLNRVPLNREQLEKLGAQRFCGRTYARSLNAHAFIFRERPADCRIFYFD